MDHTEQNGQEGPLGPPVPAFEGRMQPDPAAAAESGPQPLSPEELQANIETVRQRRAARQEQEQDAHDGPDRSGAELLRAAAAAKAPGALSDTEIVSALDHFMATEQDAEVQVEPKPLKLNLGTKDSPQWVRWVIAPVSDTEITQIRKNSTVGTRAQRRRGESEPDESLVSRKLVVRGTVDPDPQELARRMGIADQADAVHAYFKRYGKTGLVTQISSEILSISGWDDEDIQEVDAARG